MERSKRWLPVKLTRQEWQDKAEQLARQVDELRAYEEETKAIGAARRERAKSMAAAIHTVNDIVRSHEEQRQVDCESWADSRRGKMITARVDTGATVEERDLTERELLLLRQGDLFTRDEIDEAESVVGEAMAKILSPEVTSVTFSGGGREVTMRAGTSRTEDASA